MNEKKRKKKEFSSIQFVIYSYQNRIGLKTWMLNSCSNFKGRMNAYKWHGEKDMIEKYIPI